MSMRTRTGQSQMQLSIGIQADYRPLFILPTLALPRDLVSRDKSNINVWMRLDYLRRRDTFVTDVVIS